MFRTFEVSVLAGVAVLAEVAAGAEQDGGPLADLGGIRRCGRCAQPEPVPFVVLEHLVDDESEQIVAAQRVQP